MLSREEFYKKKSMLNKSQSDAVDALYGAVFVIAAPGTGKTHTLTMRILNLLESDIQVAPETILALTYTDAAAMEMRRRLIEYVGQDAYRLNIHTFHSWCNDIISRNEDYFGIRDFEPISELEEIYICREIIDELLPDNKLKRTKGDIYFEVTRMRSLYKLMKREGWSFDHVVNACNEYIKGLEHREEYIYKRANEKKGIKVGDLKTELIAKEVEKITLMMSAAAQYDRYLEKMNNMRRYDFDDMLLWVKKAYSEDAAFLTLYQEKYQYVLVDEFQDTNGIQSQLIDMLMSYWTNPNIFVVGDDDQALYEFNGARIKNMHDFVQNYKPSVICLTENYRSHQSILDHAMNVIVNNGVRAINFPTFQRLSITKDMTSQMVTNVVPDNCAIEFKTFQDEQIYLIMEISRLISQGVDPSKIAIIYRKHAQAEIVLKAFLKMGIPVNVKRKLNILHTPLIAWIIDILTFFNSLMMPNSSANKNLILGNFVKICANSLSGFRQEDVENAIIGFTEGNTEANVVSRIVTEIRMNDPGNVNLPYLETIERCCKKREYVKPMELIEDIVEGFQIFEYCAKNEYSNYLFHQLYSFYAWLKGLVFKSPSMSVEELIKLIDNIRDEGLSVPTINIDFSDSGVNMMTSHGSKGLEFDYVYLIGATSSQWSKSYRGGSYKIPDTLHFVTDTDADETSRRLFFVSLTRARLRFVATYYREDDKGKPQEPVQFIIESQLPIKEHAKHDNHAIKDYIVKAMSKAPSFQTSAKAQHVKRVIENMQLSVSAINKYMRCPVSFYFENVLRVPFVANAALVYGDCVHRSLRATYEQLKSKTIALQAENISSSLNGEFNLSFANNFGQIPDEQYKAYLNQWQIDLPVISDMIVRSNIVTVNEFYSKWNLFSIPFTYIFDKIEFDGVFATIVDYKTGRAANVYDRLKPAEGDYVGGDIWRQMVVGKMILDRLPMDWRFSAARIDIIDGNESGSTLVQISSFDESTVERQIIEVWEKIQNLEFSPGCGECFWCKLKSNQ